MYENKNIPITDRTRRIRAQYLETPVAKCDPIPLCYGNHPLTIHWLEGFWEAQHAPTTLIRRSCAEVAELDRSKVIVAEDELITGQPDLRLSDEEQARFDRLYEMFRMAPAVHPDGRSDHMALDYQKLLRVGVDGLISEITAQKEALTFSQQTMEEDISKEEFYDACLMELQALLRYAGRYESHLRTLAENAAPSRRTELLAMADNLKQVPRGPAKTFWQALQSVHFYTFTLRGLYAYGRPDQLFWPYYESDIAAGRLTKEQAQELIDNFCLGITTYVHPYCASGMMIGGTDEEGVPVENDLTWMFLTAVDHIRMPDPNLGLCVTDQTSDELLRYAMDMIGRGCTFPSFWNDAEVVRSLQAFGFAEKDSHQYINSTCVETTIIGKSGSWTACPYHNLAELMLEVFMEGDYPEYTALEEAVFARIRRSFIEENHKINRLKLERSRNASEPMRHSCLVDDCISRGKSVGQGGAVYSPTLPNTLGFANVVDALSAIRELVYNKKELTLEQYRQAVKTNFDGQEALRQKILNRTVHYGNGDEHTDQIAANLAQCMHDACIDLHTFHGDFVMPGIFSYAYHELYGRNTPATPDGRLAGQPLADSAGPAQGRDTQSPTAALRSGTAWPQGQFLGGVAQNIRLSKQHFLSEDKAIPISLMKGFFARGGCELQFNCVSTEELEDAMEHPELHGDLLVRIGGYSDRFVAQSKQMQEEIISRTNY